jgi:DNA-binding transcriptional MocR family regulator
MVEKCAQVGIRIRSLSEYFHGQQPIETHCLVVNYAGLKDEDIDQLAEILEKL